MNWPAKDLLFAKRENLDFELWHAVAFDELDSVLAKLEKLSGPLTEDRPDPDEQEWQAFMSVLLSQPVTATAIEAFGRSVEQTSQTIRQTARWRATAAREMLKKSRTLDPGAGRTELALLPFPPSRMCAHLIGEGTLTIAWVCHLDTEPGLAWLRDFSR